MCPQLGEMLRPLPPLLYLSVHFPTGVARGNEPLAVVKPRQPKKLGAMFFEDCLCLLGCLDHFLRFVAFEARKLYDRQMARRTLSIRGNARIALFVRPPYENLRSLIASWQTCAGSFMPALLISMIFFATISVRGSLRSTKCMARNARP